MSGGKDDSNPSGGLLTPSQRDYLRGQADVEEDSTRERMTRSRIRDRVQAAFRIDIPLLAEKLRDSDRDQILDNFNAEVTESLIELVAWVHQSAEAIGLHSERILEAGIERGETRLGNETTTVDVEIETHSGIEKLKARFEVGDPTLTGHELARLQRESAIDTDTIGEYYGQALGNDSEAPMVSTSTPESMVDTNNSQEDGP